CTRGQTRAPIREPVGIPQARQRACLMSNALAISGVTAVLQYFLNIAYNNPSSVLGGVGISALAPDIVQSNLGSGANAQLQVNLFMHQVTHNAAWRNMGMAAVSP